MRLGVIRRILKEDLQKTGGDLPIWLDALLTPLNQFITVVSQGLTNNLTFVDNFLGRETSLEFTHGVELSIEPKTTTKPSGVFVKKVSSGGSGANGEVATLVTKWGWVQKSNGNIGVTFYFDGGTSSTKRTVTLFIMAG